MVDVDPAKREVVGESFVTPPPHGPGVLPGWVAEQGVDAVIVGGMGGRARQMFAAHGVDVIAGALGGTPAELVVQFLGGSLRTDDQECDHSSGDCGHDHGHGHGHRHHA